MSTIIDYNVAMPLSRSLQILQGLALSHARESGPYAAELYYHLNRDLDGDLNAGRAASLLAYEPSYSIGATASDVLHMRQALGFFTKLEDLDIGVDKEHVAYEKFVGAEDLCRRTNEIERMRRAGKFSYPPHVESALRRARRKIANVLGPCPTLADLKLGFGPGATVSIKRNEANPTAKMAAGFECSIDAFASGRLPELLREVPHWCAALEPGYHIDEEGWLCEVHRVSIETGKLAFVPKNAKTYRSIMVEPCLNGFVQNGLGDLIARRLRSVGIDIRDQTRNQELALLGSITGEFATIDLSSASDTIATGLVRALLPDDWFSLLSAWRTSTCSYKGQEVTLEKFSSMGNGFTFPLETLIFWSITRAVCGHGIVHAYGDDLICPAEYFDEVADVLRCVGFVVNTDKSYASGPFRESCGCDYYEGINVRPYYQKQLVSVRTLFTLHNWYVRRFDDERAGVVRGLIPRHLRIYGPDGYGDGHLVSHEYPKLRPKSIVRAGWGGHYFETMCARPEKFKSPYPGDWVSPLYSVYRRGEEDLSPFIDGLATGITGLRVSDSGRPYWTKPGASEYSRVKIYTLG